MHDANLLKILFSHSLRISYNIWVIFTPPLFTNSSQTHPHRPTASPNFMSTFSPKLNNLTQTEKSAWLSRAPCQASLL